MKHRTSVGRVRAIAAVLGIGAALVTPGGTISAGSSPAALPTSLQVPPPVSAFLEVPTTMTGWEASVIGHVTAGRVTAGHVTAGDVAAGDADMRPTMEPEAREARSYSASPAPAVPRPATTGSAATAARRPLASVATADQRSATEATADSAVLMGATVVTLKSTVTVATVVTPAPPALPAPEELEDRKRETPARTETSSDGLSVHAPSASEVVPPM